MRVSGWMVACGAVLVAVAGMGAATDSIATPASSFASTSKAQPGVWLHHAVIVDLRNLPKRYTCDELWYKFRDVLQALGARADLKILPYRCNQRLGSVAFSPSVELVFSMPREVTGKNVRWADVQVVPKSVRLQPGAPPHLDDGDCALLKQIKDTLLQNIGATVTSFHLACDAPRSSLSPAFGLTVQALVPGEALTPLSGDRIPSRS